MLQLPAKVSEPPVPRERARHPARDRQESLSGKSPVLASSVSMVSMWVGVAGLTKATTIDVECFTIDICGSTGRLVKPKEVFKQMDLSR